MPYGFKWRYIVFVCGLSEFGHSAHHLSNPESIDGGLPAILAAEEEEQESPEEDEETDGW